VFGGEPSGAWIWPEQTRCPDGPRRRLHAGRAGRRGGIAVGDGRRASRVPDSAGFGADGREGRWSNNVAELAHERFETVSTLDGIRVETDAGWFLVRASGTEPLVRITAEARNADDADDLFETARDLIDRAAADRSR